MLTTITLSVLSIAGMMTGVGVAAAEQAPIPADCSTINALVPTVSGTLVTAKAHWRCAGAPNEGSRIVVRLQQDTTWSWRTVETGDHWRDNPNFDEVFSAPTHQCAGGGWQTYRTWTFGLIGAEPTVNVNSGTVRVWCG